MNALDLILLGRQLAKIGEEVLRGSAAQSMPAGPSLVLRDVFAHPDSSITDVTARTGLPQSYVSESVARLRDQGIVQTSADPADGRRTLVRLAAGHPATVAAKGSASVDAALATALGEPEGGPSVTETIDILTALAARLRPASPGPSWRRSTGPGGGRDAPRSADGRTAALGQYLVYAKLWQRVLIGAAVIGGAALLTAVGIATGHVVMAVLGAAVLLAAGNACAQVVRARRGHREVRSADE